MLYKYDLPVENVPAKFKNQLMEIEEDKIKETPLLALYDRLDIDLETSYEAFVLKVN